MKPWAVERSSVGNLLVETFARALSDAEFEALHARAVDEEPHAELALRLRCSEAVVRKRVSRAIARVRSLTGDADGLP
jgi:RNA polymerase sigma-70 factor (ECF subfamily)